MEDQRSSTLHAVRKLKRGGDYRLWAAQFRASLTTMGVERWLTEDPELAAPGDVMADAKVRSRMLLCVEDRGLARIIDQAATTMAAWERVRAEYEAELELRRRVPGMACSRAGTCASDQREEQRLRARGHERPTRDRDPGDAR